MHPQRGVFLREHFTKVVLCMLYLCLSLMRIFAEQLVKMVATHRELVALSENFFIIFHSQSHAFTQLDNENCIYKNCTH